MDLIYDPNLVLYLPLHKQDGLSFMSEDAYGHLCTADSPLWKPEGRYFDGNDDINCGSNGILNFTDTPFTFIAWVNSTLSTAMDILCRNESETKNGYFLRIVGDGRIGVRTSQNSTNQTSYSAAGAVPADVWTHIAAARNGADVVFYRNGNVLPYSTQDSHSNPGSYAGDFIVGSQNGGGRAFNGYIGTIMVFNRALTSRKIQEDYLATRWRYQ